MDVFYEESAISKNSKREGKKFRLIQILSNVMLTIGFILTVVGCGMFDIKDFFIWFVVFCLWFFLGWFILFKFKNRYNVNYDYVFVSGEIRIARVINTTKRKPVARLQAEDIIQIGDVDTPSFEEVQAEPNMKIVYCSSNAEPSEGKFFMYIRINNDGKKLYILECREELLANIMKFAKRTALARDYVAQDKKK